MKKIFILTGEASGDKLASKVISKLKKDKYNPMMSNEIHPAFLRDSEKKR